MTSACAPPCSRSPTSSPRTGSCSATGSTPPTTGSRGEEGTFTICSFWLVSALTIIGESERARALYQKLLSFAGPLHLYAEEIDATTGQHLGNFPQAFTHLALIDAGRRLIAVEQDA